MMITLAFLATLVGLTLLALAMPKHARDIFPHPLSPATRIVLRGAGWGLLALGLAACIARWTVTVGLTAWCGVVSVAALTVAFALTYAVPALLGCRKGAAEEADTAEE